MADIAGYTLRNWGIEQAIFYLDLIEQRCGQLAVHPRLGRSCDEIRPGLRRMEVGKHVVFYRQQIDGILISRIMHERMLAGTQMNKGDF